MGKDPIEERKNQGFRGRSRKHIESVDWTQIDAKVLVHSIAAVSAAGGALRFGYSRDGGAYALGVYGDGDTYTEFEHDPQAMEGLLHDLGEWFTDQPRASLESQGGKKRP